MKRIVEDSEEHIKNKAYMSFDDRKNAEKLAEYVAGEIIKKRLTEELEKRIGAILEKLNENELFLLETRYFRRKRKVKEFYERLGKEPLGSKRTYFRRQERLLKKLTGLFLTAGLNEKEFTERYANVGILFSVLKYIKADREKAERGERALLRSFSEWRERETVILPIRKGVCRVVGG